jgi:Cu(I)/Ag(I) efflux system membrane protein CusA/SilA
MRHVAPTDTDAHDNLMCFPHQSQFGSFVLNRRLATGAPLKHEDIEAAVIEGAVQRLRPKLMTVCVVLASLVPILWETGVGADVMKPIAAPIVGGMITSTIHVLILVPIFFALMKERALRRGTLRPPETEPI